MSIGNTTRLPSGAEAHLMLVADDVLQGISGAMTELIAFTGHPANMLQITPTNGVNAATVGSGIDYPVHNATLPSQAAMTSTQVKLDATLTSVDVIGLMIVITSGTGIGQVKIITGFSSLTATVHSAWATQPAASDGYLILIPLARLSKFTVKGEFDTSKVTAPNALVEVALYDIPPTSGAGASTKFTRAPIRCADADTYIINKNHTTGAAIGGYFHGGIQTRDCSGYLGAKVRIVTAPAVGKISIWGSGV